MISPDECLIEINYGRFFCMFSMHEESDLVESFVFG